jgi:hypothetical protein
MSGAVDLLEMSALDLYAHPAIHPAGYWQLDLSVTQLHNLSDFTLGSGAIVMGIRKLSVGLATTQMTGSEFYWERSYTGMLSWRMLPSCRIGLTGSYQLLQFDGGYDELGLITFSVGAVVSASDNAQIAASLHNLNHPSYFSEGQSLPYKTDFSSAYQFNNLLSFYSTYHLEEKMPDRLSVAQKAVLSDQFVLRLGLQTNPLDVSGGISVKVGKFCFDYAYSDNIYLGGTHRIGLRYSD